MLTTLTCLRPVLIATLLLLSSCAFGTREAFLRNSDPVPSDTSNLQHQHDICFDGLVDSRTRQMIGHVQNTYGTNTAKVVAKNSVQEWINNEIRIQLTNAGYHVAKNCVNSDNAFIISGKILTVYTTAYLTYLGELTVQASIASASGTLLDKKYAGHSKTGTNWAATSESFAHVLEGALKQVVAELVADLDSLDKQTAASSLPATPDAIAQPDSPVLADTNSTTSPDRYESTQSIKCPDSMLTIQGVRTRSGIKPAIDSIRLMLKRLYNERYEVNSSLGGSMCISFPIDKNGKTGDIVFINDDLNDPPLKNALVKHMSSVRFSKTKKSAEPTLVTCRFVFNPASAKSSKGALIGILVAVLLVITTINLVNTTNNISKL